MPAPTIDTVAWPLVYITFVPMDSLAEVESYLQALEPVYERGKAKPFITVADLGQVSATSLAPALRSRMAAGLSDLDKRYPTSKAGEAVIISSGVTRAAYAAMNLIRPRAHYERKVFPNKPEARDWARALAVKVLQAAPH